MSNAKLKKLEEIILKIKEEMQLISAMRPGSLTQQSRQSKKKPYGEYWQLSYTHKGKGGTEYIPEEFLNQIRREVDAYKDYKKLHEELISLSIECSKIRLKMARGNAYDYP